MDTIEAIMARRAFRTFQSGHAMPEEETGRLLALAQRAPSAFNLQHWRFVVVRDPALRRNLRGVSWDQPQVTDASLLVALCVDLAAWRKDGHRAWAHTDADTRETWVGIIERFYEGRGQLQRDEAMRSLGMTAQTLMLAAAAMGYETCPMDGFDAEAVAKLLNLPDDHVVGMFVAVGKAAASAAEVPRAGRFDLETVTVVDRFPA